MAGPIRISILANGAQARREIATTSSSLGRLGRLAKSGLAVAGVGSLVYGMGRFAASAVKAEAEFSTTMRLIQASTKAPSAEMRKLNDLAIQLGADTAFSAQDAAGAMLELAKAGIDTKTIMGGGLQGTLQLAAAGGTELGTAATIASNALNTFALKGRDMKSVAAALAGGANASSASVESLGQALQQVGPGATNAGLDLQETVAALSAFDAAGVKGSDAGTSLKTMLARLVPQTDKAANAMKDANLNFTDAHGNFVSLANISGQLARGLGDLSDKERTVALNRIFGSDASRAATVLMKEGADGIREYIKATNDQSAAQKMANARMGGTAGALERLSGSVETAKLRLGQELAPVVESVADTLSKKLVPAMDSGIEFAKDFGNALAPALRPVGEMLGDIAGAAGDSGGVLREDLIPAVRTLAEIVGGALDAINNLPGPIKEIGIQAGIAALALPKLTGAISDVQGKVGGMISSLTTAETRMGGLKTAARNAAGIGGILALTSALGDVQDEGTNFGDVMRGAAGGAGIGMMFGPVGALIGAGVGGGLTALTGAFSETTDEARKARLEMIKTQGMESAKAGADRLRESLQGVVNAYGKVGRASVTASFTGDDGKLADDVALLRGMGVSMDTVTSAAMGNAKAMRLVNQAFAESGAKAESNRDKYKRMWLEAQDGMTEWTDYYGNVHVKKLSGEEVADLERKYKYWSDQVKRSTADARTFGARIDRNTGAISEHSRLMRQLARDLGLPLKEYKKFPKSIRTEVEANGLPETADGAIRLIRQYKGLQNFKAIKAVISAPGVDLTRSQVVDLQKKYKLTPKQIDTLFRLEGIGDAISNLNGGISTMKGNASSGGQGVGAALSQGVAAGIANNAWQAVNAAADMVADAVAAARSKKGADSNSPSRKTMKLGKDMADGLRLGMSAEETYVRRSGERLASAAFSGMDQSRTARSAFTRAGAGRGGPSGTGAFPRELTLVIEGRPVTAIVRRELRSEARHQDRLDDRD